MNNVRSVSKVRRNARRNVQAQKRWIVTLLCAVMVCPFLCVWAEEIPFKYAAPGYQWRFPLDHGTHRGYQTEWWYYTGQLYSSSDKPFEQSPKYGFQLTFFRKALRSGNDAASVYLAHAVLTDIHEKRVVFNSRMAGESLGVGMASQDRLNVSMGDWSAEEIGGEHVLKFSVSERRSSGIENLQRHIRLRLRAAVEQVHLQGDRGFSKKGECETCASLYYSIPHLKVLGEVYSHSNDTTIGTPVHGIAWMDHEIMTNALSEEQIGWDRMGLMFRDGRHLTVFQLRTKTGEPYRSAALCKQGVCEQLRPSDFTLQPQMENVGSWSSLESKAVYPIRWRIVIPGADIDAVVQARIAASELREQVQSTKKSDSQNQKGGNTPIYWEGPVSSTDESVLGYLEMTGYSGKIAM